MAVLAHRLENLCARLYGPMPESMNKDGGIEPSANLTFSMES